ncbi:MAG: hypothetical protein KDJ74_18040, partial [Notoacmeibacter sp.]|nr:hypothetical protein [Notoacmeibacter sp.]
VRAANWSVLASYNHAFSSTLSASIAYQYFDGFGNLPNGHLGELSVVWMPVKNFEVRGELGYAKTQGFNGTTSGFVRFTRYF